VSTFSRSEHCEMSREQPAIRGETLRQVRVGIDVGGTFTDVVVIDHDTLEVIGQLKVPTTHNAPEGVARGVIAAIERALSELSISPEEVIFIAHSTTQATNALLEGDVAAVGVIGVGRGIESWPSRRATRVPAIELAPGRVLAPVHRFIKSRNGLDRNIIARLVAELRRMEVDVIVASEAFGVDRPQNEQLIAEEARKFGMLATSGHEVSTLYGLRTRTRTAVLNAAILPKMVETAEMTAHCVERAGITAPLMIMRSDGGVMSIAEVHRRPIMTMLSGPAAGIAGALMYERVSDGIFIEVGGTSADVSVIRDGQPQSAPARVGGHRIFLNTLDSRTLAIAGGSMLRESGGKIIDVGPRSAHIAGLEYGSFAEADELDGARLVHLKPTPRDASDYVAVETRSGKRFALTPTCAANLLGIIPEGTFARGNTQAARAAFHPLALALGVSVEEAARRVLDVSCRKIVNQVEGLIAEYRLDRATLELVGGGGAAAVLVPHAAKMIGLPFRIARKAEVISTIGVALAMVRDLVERHIVDPSPEDILRVRREAFEAVVKAGALPDTVEVQIEVDKQRNLVRAIAFGTTKLKRDQSRLIESSTENCRIAAARSMQVAPEQVCLVAKTSGLYVFVAPRQLRALFGLFKRVRQMVRVTDRSGVIRLQRSHAEVASASVANIAIELERIIVRLTDFGDAGRALPDVQVLVGARIINLSGLADVEQAKQLAGVELENLPPGEPVVIVAAPKREG
jgi:N-methylhydantoinase A